MWTATAAGSWERTGLLPGLVADIDTWGCAGKVSVTTQPPGWATSIYLSTTLGRPR